MHKACEFESAVAAKFIRLYHLIRGVDAHHQAVVNQSIAEVHRCTFKRSIDSSKTVFISMLLRNNLRNIVCELFDLYAVGLHAHFALDCRDVP